MKKNKSLSRKLLVYVLLTSTLLTALFSSFSFFMEYYNERNLLDEKIVEIQVTRTNQISQALWDFNKRAIESEATGIASLDDFISSEITDEQNKQIIKVYSQKFIQRKIVPNIKKTLPLYASREKEKILVGYLNIEATNVGIIERILKKVALFFLLQGLKTFSISLLLLHFFEKIIITKLTQINTHLEKLKKSSWQIDSSILLNLNSKDEIYELGATINLMSRDLRVYIQEVKEKVRMSHELELAKIVQSSFIPTLQEKIAGEFELQAFYQPASECGGDWWGHFLTDKYLVIGIGDTTGHGMGAALVTSGVHSVFHLYKEIVEKEKSVPNPADLMRHLNQTVCASSNQFNMTFFVAVFDLQNKWVSYSNASHNKPMLIRPSEVVFFDEINDVRLGQSRNELFKTATIDYKSNDTIVFFTDGLVEWQDNKGRTFSEKKLLEKIQMNLSSSVSEINQVVLKEINQGILSTSLKDDIIYIILRMA